MGSSVASSLVLGVPTEKNCNLYARASEASERLKTYFQVSKYICIHTINAVPFYYSGMALLYDSIMISRVASFWYWGGGGKPPKCTDRKKSCQICASERLRNSFYRLIFSGLKIHLHTYTINAVPFYQNMVWRYKRQYDKTLTLRKI